VAGPPDLQDNHFGRRLGNFLDHTARHGRNEFLKNRSNVA